MIRSIRFHIPWPPSVNRVWRQFKGRTILSAEGRAYRHAVAVQIVASRQFSAGPLPGLLSVEFDAHQPDRRRRDVDNLFKAPLDALTHARVWGDDSQIIRLSITKRPVDTTPRITVTIREFQS